MIKLQFDGDREQISQQPRQDARPGTTATDSIADSETILLRRIYAYLFDIALLGALGTVAVFVMGILGLMSFGLLWIGIVPLLLLLVLGYDTVSCSGKQQATAGMQLMGLQMQSKDGGAVTLAQAFMQSAGFYVSVAFTSFLILGVALLNAERRCLHDFISGIKFIRRRGVEPA